MLQACRAGNGVTTQNVAFSVRPKGYGPVLVDMYHQEDNVFLLHLLPATTMLSITVANPKSYHFFSVNNRRYSPPVNALRPGKPHQDSALIIPSSSSSISQKQQQLYQPFRPPPSPLPSKYRSLDTEQKIEILSNRLGVWFEYAPLIPSLIQEGFLPSTIEELTGITSHDQNRLVVASQVRDSLIESTDNETAAFFDSPGAPEILCAIRILNTPQRASAARFIIENGFEGKQAEELARSMKDFPRRYADRGYESFNGNLPGDCLAFMYYRQAQEHKSASSPESSKMVLERALEVAVTDGARKRLLDELEGNDGSTGEGGVDVNEFAKVLVVRLEMGEVAESTVVVVLPVCRSEMRETEVEEAPWECVMGGEFTVVQAEKGWSQWVVLPGWAPIAGLRRGGVAVAFPKARGVLPVRSKMRDADEEILVVADRNQKEVAFDDGFYLVLSGSGEGSLKVERGAKLKETGVVESLGTVVLVVRPPREEDDQLGADDWD